MKYQSKAIPLKSFKYSESSIIAKILTQKYGIQTFILKGVHSKTTKKKLALLQPLSLIEISAAYRPKRNLQQIQEISLAKATNLSIEKELVKLFMAEVLTKVIYESEKDSPLFNFIWDLICKLNTSANINKNFPLTFLINLSRYLGFYPDSSELFCLSNSSIIQLSSLLENQNPILNKKERGVLLNSLFVYYQLNDYDL